jgi:hypothetical protein
VEEKNRNIENQDLDPQISRKEAIVKAGKYAAFTAAAMMLILEPSQAQPPKSPPKPPRGSSVQKSPPKPRTDPPPSF